jgi:hypothetical protein
MFREQLRKELVIDSLRQRDVVARIAVSEREIRRWLEQQESTRGSQIDYDISQILIALPQDPSPEQVLAAEGGCATCTPAWRPAATSPSWRSPSPRASRPCPAAGSAGGAARSCRSSSRASSRRCEPG